MKSDFTTLHQNWGNNSDPGNENISWVSAKCERYHVDSTSIVRQFRIN